MFAKVSKDGNLSNLKYLLTVEGFISNLFANTFCDILLDLISSRNLFCMSSILIIEK